MLCKDCKLAVSSDKEAKVDISLMECTPAMNGSANPCAGVAERRQGEDVFEHAFQRGLDAQLKEIGQSRRSETRHVSDLVEDGFGIDETECFDIESPRLSKNVTLDDNEDEDQAGQGQDKEHSLDYYGFG